MARLAQLISGVGWGASSSVATALLQLGLMAVMARLLDPADFGLVAMAGLALRFFGYFAQMGVTPALIQKPQLDDADLRAALAVSLGGAALFALLAALAAPLLEWAFAMPGLALVIRLLALNFLTGGASAVSAGLLRRHSRFRALALIDTTAYAIGYGVVGASTAFRHPGALALVCALLTQGAISAVLGWYAVRYPLRLRHDPQRRRHFMHYGGRYSLVGFVEFLGVSLDSLVIGRLAGSTALGYYNRGSMLGNLPIQQPANVLSGVLFPMMSAIADQRAKLSLTFQLGTLVTGSYACAAGLGIATAADDLVRLVLGQRWMPAAPVLMALACQVALATLTQVAGVTLDAMNELTVKLKVQAAFVVLLALLLALAAGAHALWAFALAVLVNEVLRVAVLYRVVLARLPVPPDDLRRIAAVITGVAAGAALAVALARAATPAGAPLWLRVANEILAGALGLALGAYALRGWAARNSAVAWLAARTPVLSRLLPEVA